MDQIKKALLHLIRAERGNTISMVGVYKKRLKRPFFIMEAHYKTIMGCLDYITNHYKEYQKLEYLLEKYKTLTKETKKLMKDPIIKEIVGGIELRKEMGWD